VVRFPNIAERFGKYIEKLPFRQGGFARRPFFPEKKD
jgi:hypothetical protein